MEDDNKRNTQKLIVSIVILTWNSEKYVKRCLDSTYENLPKNDFEIIVVDNGSKDGTLSILESYRKAQSNFKFIALDKNYGTTVSRNIAIKKSKGEYILILDSDTEIKKGALKELVTVLDSEERIGLVAPRLLYPDGSVQFSYKKFPTLTLKILKGLPIRKLNLLGEKMELYESKIYSKDFNEAIGVDYCISACWLVRKKALEEVGLFDENIFYAPEDVDLCIRMWLNGFKVIYNPKVTVIHHTQRVSKKNFRIAILHAKGLIYYFAKYRYLFSRDRIYKSIKKNRVS
jgi:hypothetical protein